MKTFSNGNDRRENRINNEKETRIGDDGKDRRIQINGDGDGCFSEGRLK